MDDHMNAHLHPDGTIKYHSHKDDILNIDDFLKNSPDAQYKYLTDPLFHAICKTAYREHKRAEKAEFELKQLKETHGI